MASDKKVAAGKQGNAMSSFLVVAALIAAGGVGRVLWKFQARLDQETPAPVAAAAPAAAAAPIAAALPADAAPQPPAPPDKPLTQITELLPATPPPAAPPPPPKVIKPVRGDIMIVGKNGTTSSVAPPTREDLAAINRDDSSTPPSSSYNTWRDPAPGPRVYKPKDPNDKLPKPLPRSGEPRYYDFESNGFRSDPQFERRTRVTQQR